MKTFTILAACALAIPAFADQFTMGGASGNPPVYFCTTGAGQPITVSLSDANCGTAGGTVSGNVGTFESPTGTGIFFGQNWSFGLPTSLGGLVGAVFTTIGGATETMSIGGNNGTGVISGTVTWTSVKDHTETPQLIGTFHVTSNANSGVLATDYPVGGNFPVDYTINLGSAPQLDALWAGTATRTQGSFSSGEVSATPETSSILLMGTGMLLAGTVVRRRRKYNQM